MPSLDKLFYPKSILIYGVSESEKNLAKYTFENLITFGFKGEIFLLGTHEGKIGKYKIHTSIDEIKKKPDLAVILVPARYVPSALEACAKCGILFAVIQTGGFSEFKKEGKKIEDELLQISEKYGISFAGPNCIGMINSDNGVVEPFFPIDSELIKQGDFSFIAQSGGIIMDVLRICSFNCIGISKLFSIGNKLKLNECDYLSYLLEDDKTDIIGFYLESFANGRNFLNIAQKSKKAIACLKSNRFPISNQIASFHTTALAGDDKITDIALKEAGIYRAQTLEDMVSFFKINKLAKLKGERIGVLCRSGGQAVNFTDVIGKYNFKLAKFSDEFFDFVESKVRANVINLTNPLDLGDVADEESYVEILEKAICEASVDAIFFGYTYLHKTIFKHLERFLNEAKKISQKYDKPVFVYLISDREIFFKTRESNDFPVFTNEDKLFSILRELYDLNKFKEIKIENVPKLEKHKYSSRRFLNHDESFKLLEQHEISFPDYKMVSEQKDALEYANKIGYPIVVKNGDENILHKTEEGGVFLNIKDEDELKLALAKIGNGKKLIQKMAQKGVECFIGCRHDVEFGAVISFGMGGIYVELIKDIALRLAPLDEKSAIDMIKETKVYKLLDGFRDMPKHDIKALVSTVVKVSNIIAKNPSIANIDINPIIVYPQDYGTMVVDIKIENLER